MKHFLIKIWYVGTNFAGSQRQPDKRTVEGELIYVLKKLNLITSARENKFKAVARTDKGVHALEGSFSFFTTNSFRYNQFNYELPDDMGLSAWAKIPEDFKPRYRCIWKEYHYFLPKLSWNEKSYNAKSINKAIKMMEGTHDFLLFSKRSPPQYKSSTLTLQEAKIIEQEGYYLLSFKGMSFLWQQIRRTIRFLQKLGLGEASLSDLEDRFDPRYIKQHPDDRESPATADGLILWQIKFPDDVKFEEHERLLQKRRERLGISIRRRYQQAFNIEALFKD